MLSPALRLAVLVGAHDVEGAFIALRGNLVVTDDGGPSSGDRQ
jgi:hypothetical protein